ncbi:MAG TPA: CHRD domain-containing protein [Acidimicrobiales bacterium]|jgi:hypothetical protein
MALAVIAMLCAAACSSDSPAARGPAPTEPATTPPPVVPHQTALKAWLSGKSVVPGPGAISGSGTALLSLDPVAGKVCYELSVRNVDPALAAAVFTGPAGAIGPATIALEPPADDNKSSGCVAVEPGIIESIVANPSGFYVRVDNIQFPGGALRGQLVK